MKSKLLFGLTLFLIGVLAFMPAKIMAQTSGESSQATGSRPDKSPDTYQESDQRARSTESKDPSSGSNQPSDRRGQVTGSQRDLSSSPGQPSDRRGQVTGSQQDLSSSSDRQTGQRVQATVIGIDRPDQCLRIRQEPSSSSEIIGCVKMSESLQLSGNYSRDGRWAKLADEGWVFAAQIDAPNKPKVQRQARRSYDYYDTEDLYIEPYESSLWHEPAGYYYGTDTGVVYGGPYRYGPRFGIGFGPNWGYRGGGRHFSGGLYFGGGRPMGGYYGRR